MNQYRDETPDPHPGPRGGMVIAAVGALYPLADDGLPATVRDAYREYLEAVQRLARATGVGE